MKKSVIEELRNKGMGADEAERAIAAVTSAILAVAKRDQRVALPNFGVFTIKTRAERNSRNPRTGEPIRVAASQALTFKASKGVIG